MTEPYDSMRVHWFGEPWPRADWRAPICEDDRYRIDVPVGESCVHCTEPIEAGDRGVRMAGVQCAHIECNLRSVLGNHLHVAGMCRHIGECNDLSTLSYREEARLVWQMQVGT